jgi:serine protease AprX
MRRVLAGIAVATIWVVAMTPAVADPDTTTGTTAPQAVELERVHADRDGDRLDDSLELRLGRHPDETLLPVIVVHDGTVTPRRAADALGRFRLGTTFRSIAGFAAEMRPVQVRAAARLPGVERVQLDGTVHATMDAADTDFGTQAARDRFGLTGAGVGVCFLDTGITRSHEQFSGTARSFVWRDFVGTGTWPYDDNGHGTHVASIAAGDGVGGASAARYGGAAPRADLAVGKVLARSGAGTESRVITGLDWCATQPTVDIVSLSLGLSLPSDGTDAMSLAVDALVERGIVVVVAAGNSGDLPGSVGSPASATDVITVGSAADW